VKVNINDPNEMATAGMDAALQFGRYVTETIADAEPIAAQAYLQSVFGTLVGLSVAALGNERTVDVLNKMLLVASEVDPQDKQARH